MLSCILPQSSRQPSKGGEDGSCGVKKHLVALAYLAIFSTPLLSGSPSKRSSACRCMRESEQHTKALPVLTSPGYGAVSWIRPRQRHQSFLARPSTAASTYDRLLADLPAFTLRQRRQPHRESPLSKLANGGCYRGYEQRPSRYTVSDRKRAPHADRAHCQYSACWQYCAPAHRRAHITTPRLDRQHPPPRQHVLLPRRPIPAAFWQSLPGSI
jgi:hypothetical protein